ncbi:hypothetical protein EYZ11_013019 [Aspergillus tanneri]|uniref:Uncharacterized protein n=1 Tax=Aspergillus tanneri TaxID=1220188 RepID=A0A4S3IYT2_9EURO|nr:hypothetical protein EYZ11_013019 [Aspergillus tanneri]
MSQPKGFAALGCRFAILPPQTAPIIIDKDILQLRSFTTRLRNIFSPRNLTQYVATPILGDVAQPPVISLKPRQHPAHAVDLLLTVSPGVLVHLQGVPDLHVGRLLIRIAVTARWIALARSAALSTAVAPPNTALGVTYAPNDSVSQLNTRIG